MKDKFNYWVNEFTALKKQELCIVLIAHVHSPRGNVNINQIQCSDTERFSIDEFNEIYQGIVNAGFYIQSVFFNEIDFISEYIQRPEYFKKCLIYNLARNGAGNNKKTLIPSFCELVGLEYTSSTALSCSLCRDKYSFSTLLESHGIPTPKSWLWCPSKGWILDSPSLNTEVICKPCAESASQGINENKIFHFTNTNQLNIGHEKCIVQEYIPGEECEVPVFKVGDTIHALRPVGIELKGKRIIDENMSNQYGYNFYDLSISQTEMTISKIMKYAEKAFNLLQMDVYGRVDFRIDSKGNPYVFDVSTTPYTIKHSSFAFAFSQLGLTYSDIYNAIIVSSLSKNKN